MVFHKSTITGSDELEKWVTMMGVTVNPNVVIKKTAERGIGVFYTNCEENDHDNHGKVELIRIPHMSSYNLQTLQYLVNNKLNVKDIQIVKKCLRIVFRFIFGNESEILIAYMIGLFVLCKKVIDKNEDGEWKQVISQYVDVLMNTKVGNLYGEHWNVIEDLVSAFPGNIILQSCATDIVESRWMEVTELINEEFASEGGDDDDGDDEGIRITPVKVEEILQICAAVRSRMLEIPRAVDSTGGDKEGKEDGDDDGDDDGDGDDDDDDFYVDVTMVPVLDFVNHDRGKRNAYFDVDLKTKDIILFLDEESAVCENKKEHEIYISYEEFEDLHRMYVNYGFIPRSSGVDKFIEIPILGYLGEENGILDDFEATKRLKLIRQSPNVQFKVRFKEDDDGSIESVTAIEDMHYGYLIFDENIDWLGLIEEDEKFDEEDKEENSEVIEDGEYYERGFRLCDQLSAQQSAEETAKSRAGFAAAVKHAMATLSSRATLLRELAQEYETDTATDTATETRPGAAVDPLLALYGELAAAATASSPLPASSTKDADAGVLALRSVPVYNWPAPAAGVAVDGLAL